MCDSTRISLRLTARTPTNAIRVGCSGSGSAAGSALPRTRAEAAATFEAGER